MWVFVRMKPSGRPPFGLLLALERLPSFALLVLKLLFALGSKVEITLLQCSDIGAVPAVGGGQLPALTRLVQLHRERREVVVLRGKLRFWVGLPQDFTIRNSTKREGWMLGEVAGVRVDLVEVDVEHGGQHGGVRRAQELGPPPVQEPQLGLVPVYDEAFNGVEIIVPGEPAARLEIDNSLQT